MQGLDIPPTGNLTHSAMMVTPSLLFHTARGDDGTTRFLYAVDKATGQRLGSLEMPGLGMYGMMSYMHEGRQRIIVPVPGALVALSLPSRLGGGLHYEGVEVGASLRSGRSG